MAERLPQLSPRERLLRGMALVGLIGSIAVPAALASESEPKTTAFQPLPEFIIGAQEDSVLSEDLEESKKLTELIAQAGFNTLKVTMPWTYPSQAEIKNDLERFQNAASAARDSKLQLMLNLIPGGGSGTGQAPTTTSQQRRYRDTLIAYEHAFEKVNPGGHLILEVPNEPNSENFWRPQKNNDGEWVAPKAVVGTLAKTYWAVKKEAQKLGIGVTLIGGGLASSHNAIGFMKAMGDARRELNHRGPVMDAISLHPYGQLNNESPNTVHPNLTTVGFADLEPFVENLDGSFAQPLPVWLSEYGAKTRVPAAQQNQYTFGPNQSKDMISEATQAEFYTKAIKMARCQSRVGAIILFNVIDDSDDSWTSGIMYPNGSPKSSYESVHQAVVEAESQDASANC